MARAYYWHRFYSHQPDLNYDNPRVRAAVIRAVDFWLEQGVDGLRLDAVPYLFERDGTDCENLPETHGFLRQLRRHIDSRFPGRMLLAEANQWPEDAVRYFGSADECHMAFHFPLMPRLFMAIRMEDRLPIVDILDQTPPIPEGCQWALFLRNHDELTLEMVTDEERDYMVGAYASDPQARLNLGIRRRLAPLLGNNRRRIELMIGLLFSLPGTPFIYYGDEIGMGDNVYLGDRDGMRTPMQWSADLNAGFSEARRHQLYLPVIVEPEYHYETVNVAIQQANPNSLLWWMKRLIALRKRHPAFGRGSLEFLQPDNHRILAFIRRTTDETVLVVANLSRFFQPIELDLSAHEGIRPIELFGRIDFPAIGKAPYALSLGPHEFMWFNLEDRTADVAAVRTEGLPVIRDAGSLATIALPGRSSPLAAALYAWVTGQPWYRGGGRRIAGTEIRDRVLIEVERRTVVVVRLSIDYMDGDTDSYLVPLAQVATDAAGGFALMDGTPVPEARPGMSIAHLRPPGRAEGTDLLFDGTGDPGFAATVLATIRRRRHIRGVHGQLVGVRSRTSALGEPASGAGAAVGEADRPGGTPDHAGLVDLELFHALEPGPDPGREMGTFLTERGFPWIHPVIGAVEYRLPDGLSADIAVARQMVGRERDLRDVTRDALLGTFEDAAAGAEGAPGVELTARAIHEASGRDVPPPMQDAIGTYLDTVRLLGTRVAEMHLVLASAPSRPAFEAQPFTELQQRALFHAADGAVSNAFRLLSRRTPSLEDATLADARLALDLRGEADVHLRRLLAGKVGGAQIRTHGALRLERVLQAGTELRIVGFEGDPGRPASERRLRRTPLSDLASVIASLRDAALGRSREALVGGSVRLEDMERLHSWARAWYLWVSATFLGSYRAATAGASFIPTGDDGWVTLLDALLLSQAFSGLSEALTANESDLRPSIRGVTELLGH